ncbi:MAG: COP23 domain-containing protein, partial [Bacteroidota bacterium]
MSAANGTFFCGSASYRGEMVPTTYMNPETGGNPVALIYWVKDYFSGSPEERCSAGTSKMQAYYDNGLLE